MILPKIVESFRLTTPVSGEAIMKAVEKVAAGYFVKVVYYRDERTLCMIGQSPPGRAKHLAVFPQGEPLVDLNPTRSYDRVDVVSCTWPDYYQSKKEEKEDVSEAFTEIRSFRDRLYAEITGNKA